MLEESDPGRAQQLYERAAKAGETGVMYNLALMPEDSKPAQAHRWWQRAAEAGLPKPCTTWR
jgi:TPR repeat protein